MLFQTGYNFCEFLFATLNEITFLKWGLLLKERTCSNRSKFSPLIVKPNTDTCIKVKNMVKKPENPKFEVFEPKEARRSRIRAFRAFQSYF